MKRSAILFCALFSAGSLLAQGVYNMAMRQAQGTAGNETHASPGAPPPASAPAQNNQPSNPALAATLQNIASLRADFENFNSSPTNERPLINDLTAAAQGAKPSQKSISKLAEHLAAIIVGNKKLGAQEQKLAQNIHAIFNSSHLAPAQQQIIFDGVQKILLAGGASSDDVATVINDLKTIATETK